MKKAVKFAIILSAALLWHSPFFASGPHADTLPPNPEFRRDVSDSCFTTLITLGRFQSVPTNLLRATQPLRGKADEASLIRRLIQILKASNLHEFPERWFSLRFDSQWENVMRTLASGTAQRRHYLELEFQRAEAFVETDAANKAFERLREQNPDAYRFLAQTKRPWIEFWSAYIYAQFTRITIPRMDFKTAKGIGVAVDTNLFLAENRGQAQAFLRRLNQNKASRDFKFWILPENMAELLDSDVIIDSNVSQPTEYVFDLTDAQRNEYPELVQFFSDKRREYEVAHGIPATEAGNRHAINDDRLLAQAAIARGIHLFVTFDQKLFNSLAIRKSAWSNRVEAYELDGKSYLSVEVQFKSKSGDTHSITIVNAARELNQAHTFPDVAESIERDRNRPLARKQDQKADPKAGHTTHLQNISDIESETRSPSETLGILLAEQRSEPRIVEISESAALAVIPFSKPVKRSAFDGYSLSQAQSELLRLHNRQGSDHGYRRTLLKDVASLSLERLAKPDTQLILEDPEGHDVFVVLGLQKKAEAKIDAPVESEDVPPEVFEALMVVESVARSLSSFNFSRDQWQKDREAFLKLKTLAQQDPNHLSRLTEIFGLKADVEGALVALKSEVNARNIVPSDRPLLTEVLRMSLGIPDDVKVDQFSVLLSSGAIELHDLPEKFMSDVTPSTSELIRDGAIFESRALNELLQIEASARGSILDQIRILASGTETSNISYSIHGISGLIIRSVLRTYAVVAVKSPGQKPKIIGITRFTELESSRYQDELRKRTESLR